MQGKLVVVHSLAGTRFLLKSILNAASSVEGGEREMLKKFEEKKSQKMQDMEQNLESKRLENIRSSWYFVTSISKKTVAGSKG